MSIESFPKTDNEKKPYVTPGLTEYGTLVEITANGTAGTLFDIYSAPYT